LQRDFVPGIEMLLWHYFDVEYKYIQYFYIYIQRQNNVIIQ